MGDRGRARSRSGFRRARRLRDDHRGVVAVVGTLLALLVFFALFGIFLTQYVPLWMEENESQFSNQMQSSLALLKSGADDQYILGGIPSYSVPFTMSSQSVPLLTQPTIATLSYLNGCPDGLYASNGTPEKIGSCDFVRLVYSTPAGTQGGKTRDHNYNQTEVTNLFEAYLPNRYFPSVTYFFENDGVVGLQGTGRAWMVAPPPMNISRSLGNLTVLSSLLLFLGNGTSFTGQGTKVVTSHLLSETNTSSAGRFYNSTGAIRTFNVTIILGVHDVCAWYNYLYNGTYHAFNSTSSSLWTLTGAQASGTLTLPPTLSVCAASLTTTYDLTLKIFNVNYATAPIADEQLAFTPGGL